MSLQVVWSLENAEMKKKIVLYKAPSKVSTIFSRRAPVSSRRVKVFTKDEILTFTFKKENKNV